MPVDVYIFAVVTIPYGVVITLALIGFWKLRKALPLVSNDTYSSFISIIISAKNEAQNIEACLLSILHQRFDKTRFELILMDDHSDDLTYDKALMILQNSSLNYQIIRQKEHKGKKQNLMEGIEAAKGNIIVTSDADVVQRHPNWLSTIASYFETYSPNLLIMPVDVEAGNGLLTRFQIIENVALMGMTAGYAGLKKPFMCNGANLAFKKEAYLLVNGYHSHLHISSGDDVLLLEDIKKLDPNLVHYYLSRELIVKTTAQKSIAEFMSQRIRWSYKAKYNPNNINLLIGCITVFANLLCLACLVAYVASVPISSYLSIFMMAKIIFDFLLLLLAADFLGRLKYIWWFLPFEGVYGIYALLIGIASMFTKPYWKGKKII